MINVTSNTAKQRFLVAQQRQMLVFERVFSRQVQSILKKQYNDAAKNIESYDLDFNYAIDKYNRPMRDAFRKCDMRVATRFSESAFTEVNKTKGFEQYETKGFIDDFWRQAIPWMDTNTARKVVMTTLVTKKLIAKIVKREMEAGNTNKDIAKKLKEVGAVSSPFRAMKIARTETHTVANYSTLGAMDQSGLIKEKEWLSANDARTRTMPFNHVIANGERVAIDDTFKRTGENLKYPGDPSGSAANIIYCRCVQLFHTSVKVDRKHNEAIRIIKALRLLRSAA